MSDEEQPNFLSKKRQIKIKFTKSKNKLINIVSDTDSRVEDIREAIKQFEGVTEEVGLFTEQAIEHFKSQNDSETVNKLELWFENIETEHADTSGLRIGCCCP